MAYPLRLFKKIFPRGLFGRSLIILLTPLILVQVVLVYTFYERHTETVLKLLSNNIAGEASLLSNLLENSSKKSDEKKIVELASILEITLHVQSHKKLKKTGIYEDTWLYDFLRGALDGKLKRPYYLRMDEDFIYLDVQLKDGIASFFLSRKKLFSRTTPLVFIVTTLSALLFFVIASLFMRNQVRSLRRLAEVAEKFGMGQDAGEFRPEGSTEIRTVGQAFNVMRERLRRQLSERTELLAGVSHDLRTPLTRMKLQLAMMSESPEIKDLQNDVADMQRMVDGFLDFARGTAEEEAHQLINLLSYMKNIVKDFQRDSLKITIDCSKEIKFMLKPHSFNRCLTNLLLNSQRYASEVWIAVKKKSYELIITVEDNGPGIPEEERENVFKPFYRPDSSRNTETGGVGLGLSIVRDIVINHGGGIKIRDSSKGGACFEIRLPSLKEK